MKDAYDGMTRRAVRSCMRLASLDADVQTSLPLGQQAYQKVALPWNPHRHCMTNCRQCVPGENSRRF